MYGFGFGTPGIPMIPSGGMEGAPAPVPQEIPKNVFRYGEQALWSTLIHQGAAVLANGTFRTFTTPIGSVGQGAVNAMSIAETSLKEGGRIPNGLAYDVFGVACYIMLMAGSGVDGAQFDDPFQTAAQTGQVLNILNNGVLTWDFVMTQVDIAPIHLIGAGGGIFGVLATADTGTPVTGGSVGNGPGSIWMYRKNPVALPGASTFSVLVRYGNRANTGIAGTTLGIKIVLLGYYKSLIEVG